MSAGLYFLIVSVFKIITEAMIFVAQVFVNRISKCIHPATASLLVIARQTAKPATS